MRRWIRWLGLVASVGLVAALATLAVITRQRAIELVTNEPGARTLPGATPGDVGMAYRDVSVTTSDGLRLAGWFVPPENGAVVVLQHGYKANRGEMLNEAAMLRRHGYGALITSTRAHDLSEGRLITFGVREMEDLAAWWSWLRLQRGVNPLSLSLLGNSMGGTMAIMFAARTPDVRGVIANSPFSSLEDTLDTSIRFFTGLPPFPFGPMIVFWAEVETGIGFEDVDARRWIAAISPRPVLLMQGGKDVVISKDSGHRLFDAALEPKELWFDPDIRHTGFDTARAAEYETRVIGFLERYVRR